MEVAFQRLVNGRGGVLEGTHLTDHRQDGGERVIGAWIKGHMEHWRGINDGVDCTKVICSWKGSPQSVIVLGLRQGAILVAKHTTVLVSVDGVRRPFGVGEGSSHFVSTIELIGSLRI